MIIIMESHTPSKVSLSEHEWLRFLVSSGSWLSREGYRELVGAAAPGAIDTFRQLLGAGIEVEKQRNFLISAIRRKAPLHPVGLLRFWLDAHALGHLVLMSFREDHTWFSSMIRKLHLTSWTPSYLLVRERVMSLAIRGATVAGWLGGDALPLYLPLLEKPGEPLEHFNVVLGLAAIATHHVDLTTTVRCAVTRWASRGSSHGRELAALRQQVRDSVEFLLDAPAEARTWSATWCRRFPAQNFSDETIRALSGSQNSPETELLILAGLNDTGDCGLFFEGLSPAVLLLSHTTGRQAAEFYPPGTLVPIIARPWTPEMSVRVLRRSIPKGGPAETQH